MRVAKFRRKKKCRKVRFDDEFEAKRRARELGFRAYTCSLCGGWHLTSQTHRGNS